ncbi:hypothetical protein CcI49_23065 [Frankia sp. CcI49]|uniref:hypothetical protein n=1 Tax=Frankia sp. CcI49 TaxID=1745382 RepID=UPI000977A1A5|nr:hypothetical protein [Frankia sp. CcI49]ONH58339.1 hypothetical protein CcI49_23065 [Frankia sp. CcI49]
MSIRRLLTSRGPSLERQQTIAIHEAGHVVAARMLGATDITVPVDRRGGGFWFAATSELDEAVILLAGQQAELVLTGRDSGRSEYDLRQARRALRRTGVDLDAAGKTAAELVRGARLDIESEAARRLDVATIGRRAA